MDPKFNRIVIAGAGGVGFWLTVALSRALRGSPSIEVYDPDTFEGGNGHLRLPKNIPTTYKVDSLRLFISFVMGDPPPAVHRSLLLPEEIRTGDWSKTLVLDCTDMDQEPREAFWKAIKESRATGIRVSYDGLGIATISPGPPIWIGDDGNGDYAIIPNLPQSFGAAGLGAQAVLYTLYTGKRLDFQTFVPTYETESIEIPMEEEDANFHTYSGALSSSQAVSGAD